MMYLSFLNTISAPWSIVLLIASAFLLSVEYRLIETFSFIFFVFLIRCWVRFVESAISGFVGSFCIVCEQGSVVGGVGRAFGGGIHGVKNGGLRGHR